MLYSQNKLPTSFIKKLNGNRNCFESLNCIHQVITNILCSEIGINNLKNKSDVKTNLPSEKFPILNIVLRINMI